MTNIVLANSSYATHGTDEGQQLQESLRLAGWTLCGFGYGDDTVDVPKILARHQPSIVVVQAGEDWRADSRGCFDKRVSFKHIEALAGYPGYKVQVVKDCPGKYDRRRAWCEEIKADALLTYYHCDAVLPLSPWMAGYPRIRHRHTIDGQVAKAIHFKADRKRAIVSGAINREVYPLRSLVVEHANLLGVAILKHPGYGCIGPRSSDYLRKLSEYKVSVACSSKYGFALRKLLESAAAGCVVVTDLPDFDRLPWLEDALIRVPARAGIDAVRAAINISESLWTPELADSLRARAIEYYDYKVCGVALSEAIIRASTGVSA